MELRDSGYYYKEELLGILAETAFRRVALILLCVYRLRKWPDYNPEKCRETIVSLALGYELTADFQFQPAVCQTPENPLAYEASMEFTGLPAILDFEASLAYEPKPEPVEEDAEPAIHRAYLLTVTVRNGRLGATLCSDFLQEAVASLVAGKPFPREVLEFAAEVLGDL